MENQRKVGLINRLGYGMGNFIGGGALSISSAWLLFFYTTYCHLPVWQATLIFAIGTYLDVIDNPIMGFVTDNFNLTKIGKKFGRRRFFILLSVPLMMFYPLLWITGRSFVYYLTTYIIYELIYTIFNVPYKCLPSEMTENYDQRQYLSGAMAVFGKIAGLVTAALPGLFFELMGKNNPHSYQAAVFAYAALMALSALLVYLTSWELPVSEVAEEKIDNPWEGVKKVFIDIFSTLRIKSFRWHLGTYIFGFGGEWLFSATGTYLFIYVLHRTNVFVSGINSFASILQLISTFLFMYICAKRGDSSKPYIIALANVVIAMIGYSLIWFFGLTSITPLIIIACIIFGLGTGGVYYIPWANYVYMADVDEIVTNRRREGIYSGAQTMAGKLIRASIMAILGVVLSATGFVEGASTQPMHVQWGIIGIVLIGVCGFEFLGMWCAKNLKVNKDSLAIVNAEIQRVKNGGKKSEVAPNVKQVVEELTGLKYEKCFGNNNIGYKEKKRVVSQTQNLTH
ncbi:MAG: MFS transporter [Liquorilactobacillus nagelii]|jgi:oligogalacturonide transporter|uniref:MFS transporter n=1 Tax=Liquorilactobacillus nagelii TaxID=82688 RepID=UPI00242A802A|nr:MFS transporter [Liquorilactobacillus nagelii]MCI1922451.1 MFS transporter [Liquorilactobacillus nagelii]MCI1977577.1 MFS transporter [Liquorilactobacillus nagelii]